MTGVIPLINLLPGSSTAEHSAVNRRVASSNLARGAKLPISQSIGCYCVDGGQVAALYNAIAPRVLFNVVKDSARVRKMAGCFLRIAGELQSTAEQVLAPRQLRVKSELLAAAQRAVKFIPRLRIILRLYQSLCKIHRTFHGKIFQSERVCCVGEAAEGIHSRCRAALLDRDFR